MTPGDRHADVDSLLGVTIGLAIIGLIGVLPLLCAGFSALTMGVGLCLGFPGLGLATLLYCVIVVRDLHRHRLV